MDRAVRLSMLVLGCGLLTMAPAGAEVRDRSASGFTVRTTVSVAAQPQRVYQDLLAIGSWWDREHTYSGDAKNMTIAAQPGGCFCEKVPGGAAVEHGRVVNVSPNKLLRLSAALGPLLAGRTFDVTGSYRIIFIVLAALGVMGLVLIAMLRSQQSDDRAK